MSSSKEQGNWKDEAEQLARQGLSWRAIAVELGEPKSTVSDYLRKVFSEEVVENKHSSVTYAVRREDANEDNSRVLLISDMHIPYHHPDTLKFLQHLKDKYKPTRIICLGDELDKHSLSYHDSDPDLPSAGDELRRSLPVIAELFKMFPKMDIIESNHGSLVWRKAKTFGIPKHYIKSYNDVLGVDDGWKWAFDLTITLPNGQKCYIHHGKASDVKQLSQQMGMCAVQGHYHETFKIDYWGNPTGLYWGMQCGCVDKDTEYLTENGWKKIGDYVGGKVGQYNPDGTLDFVEPIKYIKVPANELTHFETKYGVSQTLCDAHRFVYKTRNGNLKVKKFSEVKNIHNSNVNGFEGKILTSFNVAGKSGIKLTDAEIRLQTAVNADGCIQETKSGSKWCRVVLRKERKISRLQHLLDAAGIEYEQGSYGEKDTWFKFEAPMLQKRFGGVWYDCTRAQLDVICDEALRWDGDGKSIFYTTVKEEADFIQYAFCATDRAASIIVTKQEPNDLYRVVVSLSRNTRGISSNTGHKCEMVPFKTKDGFKYCFEVPSGMLVLRNNDCVFVTGNCLIDDDALAFNYNNVNIKRPIIGTAVIINSMPILEPMLLDSAGNWVNK